MGYILVILRRPSAFLAILTSALNANLCLRNLFLNAPVNPDVFFKPEELIENSINSAPLFVSPCAGNAVCLVCRDALLSRVVAVQQ